MSVPKSVTKVSRDGSYKFVSNVNAVEYTLQELVRGALRDTGKFLAKQFRISFYSKFRKGTGLVGKGTGYWVRKRECDMQIGIARKGKGFWGIFQEIGTNHQKKEGLLRKVVEDNIDNIIKIQGQYLSELNKEKPSLRGIDEGDMEGD